MSSCDIHAPVHYIAVLLVPQMLTCENLQWGIIVCTVPPIWVKTNKLDRKIAQGSITDSKKTDNICHFAVYKAEIRRDNREEAPSVADHF